jgi:hypothetical protein
MSQSTVQVFDDPTTPTVRNVTVTASTNVPPLSWLFSDLLGHLRHRRRFAPRCPGDDGARSLGIQGAVCGSSAAKLFTGQFANGRDRIGLVSFNDNQ